MAGTIDRLMASGYLQKLLDVVQLLVRRVKSGDIPWASVAVYGGSSLLLIGFSGATFMRCLLGRLYTGVRLFPPTARQLADQPLDANPLFRALPVLRERLAWRELGDAFPTPLHRFVAKLQGEGDLADEEVDIWVKREDLSSGSYGGNKVRTLQYSLASFEACVDELRANGAALPRLYSMGSFGSNLLVAVKMYAARLGLPAECIDNFPSPDDEKEMDNTLNYLSAVSLPGYQPKTGEGAGHFLAGVFSMSSGPSRPWLLAPGGNVCAGVLGQVGGVLELAEQIERGEMPDPDGIVVAYGSGCTTTGFVFGVALARHLKKRAFRKPDFKIFSQIVHPMLRVFGMVGFFHSQTMPLAIGRGIREVSQVLVGHGGPDVAELALQVMKDELIIRVEPSVVGKYGAHSKVSREAKDAYDSIVSPAVPGTPGLWVCGHFTGKSFALLLDLVRRDWRAKRTPRTLLFWQTKSHVQPRGAIDEWAAFTEDRKGNRKLQKLAVLEGISGHPEWKKTEEEGPARGPDQYRGLMTQVQV